MVYIIIISVLAGYILARTEIVQRLLSKFRFENRDELDDEIDEMLEELDTEPEKVRIIHDRIVSIWKKQKKGKAAKYYPEPMQKFVCDLVTYKDGKLVCHLKDSMLEEEFSIKDIDEFII